MQMPNTTDVSYNARKCIPLRLIKLTKTKQDNYDKHEHDEHGATSSF